MSNIRKALENENVSEDMIKKVLKELGIKESKRWSPVAGEEYWWVSTYGLIFLRKFDDNVYSKYLKATGAMFKTKQEAEHHRDKIYFLGEMKMDFEDNSDEIDWRNMHQNKYHIYFSSYAHKIEVDCWSTIQNQGTLCTTNKEWLEQYIIDNETQIKKYCFGIE